MSGLLNHTPAEIIQYYLDDQSLGSLPSDDGSWPVFATLLPDTPDNAMGVFDTEGISQGRDGVEQERVYLHGIQLRLRSASHTTGYQKIQAIARNLDTVHRVKVPIASDTYMLHAVTLTSDILVLGVVESPGSRRRTFTLNAVVSVTPLAGTSS